MSDDQRGGDGWNDAPSGGETVNVPGGQGGGWGGQWDQPAQPGGWGDQGPGGAASWDQPGGQQQPGWGQEQQQQQGWGQQGPGWQQSSPSSTNGLAIASLVVGILALFTGFFLLGGVLGLIAIGLGIGGISAAKRLGGGKGLAIGGIVTGVLGIVIAIGVLIFGVLAANVIGEGIESVEVGPISAAVGGCQANERAATGTVTLQDVDVSDIVVCSDSVDDYAFSATISNTSDEAVSTGVQFEALDSSGEVLGTGDTFVSLEPGASSTESVISFDGYDGSWTELRVTQTG